jgi:hypothetical protein
MRSAWYAVACCSWISEGFMTGGILPLEALIHEAAGWRLPSGDHAVVAGASRTGAYGRRALNSAGIWRRKRPVPAGAGRPTR